jgi:quercetin dioxygenase-like cupin family protein
MDQEATITSINEQTARNVFGVQVAILARSATTDGQYSSYVCTVQPGQGAPPHLHAGFDEAFYVLEGSVEVLVKDQVQTVAAGSFVFLPRGIVHTFRNSREAPAKFLGIATPGGHDMFFDDVDAISQDGPPSMEDSIQVCQKNGIELVAVPV